MFLEMSFSLLLSFVSERGRGACNSPTNKILVIIPVFSFVFYQALQEFVAI